MWHGDRDKFMAAIVAPVRFQKILFPIFAFNYEISRIAFQTSEPALAEIKLKWWEEELTSIRKNNFSNKHEILASLSEIIITNNIPIELFIEIISARRFDIYNNSHNNFEDQVHYIKQIFSSLFEICLHASSSLVDKNQINCVRDYGYALGVANLLVALPALILAGKKPLYIERTQEESIKKITESGLQALFDGRHLLKYYDFELRPILLSACTINSILSKVFKNPKLVLQNKVRPSSLHKGVKLLLVRLGWVI